MVISRTAAEIEAVAGSIVDAGGSAWSHVADVSDYGQVTAAVEAPRQRWDGRIDVLVNNAGIDHDLPFLEFDPTAGRR